MQKQLRILILAGVVLLIPAGLVLAAGQAEGPDTEIQMPRQPRQFISPQGDADAINELVLPFSEVVAPRPGNVVVEYHLTIFDIDGNMVWRRSDLETGRRGFFGNLFGGEKPRVQIPDTLVWDGTFSGSELGPDGEYVPDGEYAYQLTILDDGGHTASTPPFAVTVDNRPPVITQLEVPYPVFAPVEGSARDTVVIRQGGSREYEWRGVIMDSEGEPVWEAVWRAPDPRNPVTDEPPPAEVRWDGRYRVEDDERTGEPAPEGRYSYEIIGRDRAGNVGRRMLDTEIELSLTFGEIALDLRDQEPAFSPNDSGIQDSLGFFTRVLEPEGVMRWKLMIASVDAPDVVLRTMTGGAVVEEQIEFDGRDDAGQVLPDGSYRAMLEVEYTNGIIAESFPLEFEIDTTPPAVSVTARTLPSAVPTGDPVVFGGETREAVLFAITAEPGLDWTAHVSFEGETIESFALRDLGITSFPHELEWRGTDLDGNELPDGLYLIHLEAIDRAGNIGRSSVLEIRKDTRPSDLRVWIADLDFDGIDDSESNENNDDRSNGADGNDPVRNSDDNPGDRNPDTTRIHRISTRPGAERPMIAIRIEAEPEDGVAYTVIEIRDAQDRVVRSERLRGPVESFEWFGRNNAGAPVADGEYSVTVRSEFYNGDILERTLDDTVVVDSTMPATDEPQLSLSADPVPFVPDPESDDTHLRLTLEVWAAYPIDTWQLEIIDPRGRSFVRFEGTGEPDPELTWNGRDPDGELVQSAEEYLAVFSVTDTRGNVGETMIEIPVGIIVIRDGDLLRILIPSIMFGPNTADLFAVSREELDKNLHTLRRLATILNTYGDHRIVIEGHAAHVFWQAGERNRLEQQQTLIPLSARRAEQVRRALVILGVDRDRLSTRGVGGALPVVPHSDRSNVWKNRRVEFILAR